MSVSNLGSSSSTAASTTVAPIDASINPTRSRNDSVGSSASSLPRRTDLRSHARSISASSISGPASIGSRKSRYAEPGTSEVHAELASFSAHPHSPRSVKSPRALTPLTRSHSVASESILSEDLVLGDPAADSGTPRLRASSTEQFSLPEPALTAKSSLSDIQSRRLSGTSIYSLASARGIAPPLPPGPAPTSDPSTRARSASNLMSSGKSLASTPPETSLSNVTVTTSSTSQGGQPSSGGHALAPRDPHSQPLDLMRRNQRSDTANTANTTTSTTTSTTNSRSQPDRSRSRVKRRFSGSTGHSSHSPGSDRDPSYREKEEGWYFLFPRTPRDTLMLIIDSETSSLGSHWYLCFGYKSAEQAEQKYSEQSHCEQGVRRGGLWG